MDLADLSGLSMGAYSDGARVEIILKGESHKIIKRWEADECRLRKS
jgi:hypothetical protein